MSELKPVKVGVVGCGNISDIYLKNSAWMDLIEVKGLTDLRRDMAEAQAAKYEVPVIYDSLADMLADDEIEIVLNITQPNAHTVVAQAAVEAGKSVYNEKPLTLARNEGKKLLETAKANGVLVGCAPDTFLGAGHQTARKLIDDGVIGNPVAANAFMMSWGMEMWHPNPEFYFKPGGGPMFDMGPYYLTDLVFLLGPIAAVSGMVTTGRKQRTITSEPLAGKVIDVEVPTHVTGLMQFASGAVGTIITSFDVAGADLPNIQIHGDKGSLRVPDPNRFGDPVLLRRGGSKEWEEVEPTHQSYAENSRGVGVNDMAYALRTGRSHRANGQLAYHVLDLMHAFHDAAAEGRTVALDSTCDRPAPLPVGLAEGSLDE
ncbi:MAG: Gfo/Idh/MocA family oxidoreductase [Anaerolineales bacterium]|nr:Gfo/Idh/MocA family oxidoreductase [Anaerolineales bacterium]